MLFSHMPGTKIGTSISVKFFKLEATRVANEAFYFSPTGKDTAHFYFLPSSLQFLDFSHKSFIDILASGNYGENQGRHTKLDCHQQGL